MPNSLNKIKNIWTKKSCILAQKNDYLDQLFNIYPIVPNVSSRDISQDDLKQLKLLFDEKEDDKLLLKLFEFEKFPFDNSFVGFFKKDVSAIDRNPQTKKLICSFIYKHFTFEELKKNLLQPKKSSRQIGSMFMKWVKTKKFQNFKTCDDFDSFIANENSILVGSDDFLKEFCNKFLGYEGVKGIDFVAKKGKKFIVGETKLISDLGGTQDKSFKDILSLINQTFTPTKNNFKICKVGILDGVPYLLRGHYLNDLSSKHNNIFSALLLEDFLLSI